MATSVYQSDGGVIKKPKVPYSAPVYDGRADVRTPVASYDPNATLINPTFKPAVKAPIATPATPATPAPVVSPVKTAAPPAGSVGIADTLKSQGYDVGWSKEAGVLVNGKPIDTSNFTLVNGRYYGNTSDINNSLVSSGVVPNQNIIPPPTQMLGTAPVSTQMPLPKAPTQGFDELMSILMGLVNSPESLPNYMSQGEARNMASSELNPEFNSAMTELNRQLNIDMEKRGIFNSPLASGIFTDKNASLEAARQSEIAKRTTGIMQEDKADANTAAQLAASAKNARMDTLSALLNTLSNRELSVAEMTGVVNGVKTLAAQEFEENKRMNEVKTKFSTAELTGMYNGIPTLAGKDQEVKIWATKIDAAMNEVNTFGEVRTQATADALKVPIGTKSYDAIKAADDRAFEWKTLMTDISNQNARAAASGSSESKTTLNQDLAMWEIMGTAPDTDKLRAYGVVPGTKWNKSAADILADKEAEAELNAIEDDEAFMKRVDTAASQYKVTQDTAAALLALYENTTRDSAFAKFNAQRDMLKDEGVDVAFLERQLNARFPKPAKKPTPTRDSTAFDPALVNQNYYPTY